MRETRHIAAHTSLGTKKFRKIRLCVAAKRFFPIFAPFIGVVRRAFGRWGRTASSGLRPPLPRMDEAAAPARVALLSALREAREGQARQRTPVWCATTVHYYYEVLKRNKLNKKS